MIKVDSLGNTIKVAKGQEAYVLGYKDGINVLFVTDGKDRTISNRTKIENNLISLGYEIIHSTYRKPELTKNDKVIFVCDENALTNNKWIDLNIDILNGKYN